MLGSREQVAGRKAQIGTCRDFRAGIADHSTRIVHASNGRYFKHNGLSTEKQIAWGHLAADTWNHIHSFVNWTDQRKYLMIRIKQNRKCEQICLHHIFVRNGLDVLEHASHLNRLELIVDNVS